MVKTIKKKKQSYTGGFIGTVGDKPKLLFKHRKRRASERPRPVVGNQVGEDIRRVGGLHHRRGRKIKGVIKLERY